MRALLECPLPAFGGAPVLEVVFFTQEDLRSARDTAKRISAGFLVPVGQPFRQLMAAATMASHADPARYDAQNRQQSVLERILVAMPPGVREVELTAADRASRDAGDMEAGRSFADLFAKAPSKGPARRAWRTLGVRERQERTEGRGNH